MKDHLTAALMSKDAKDDVTFRTAIVDDADPVQVTLAEQSGISASWIQAYTENNPPSAQDQVVVYQTKTAVIIVGRIVNGGE